jgi:hypothetical protein
VVWSVRAKESAQKRLRDLLVEERRRAQLHVTFIRRTEPTASSDRLAQVMLGRWTKVAAVEGGITGALGFAGIPLNSLLITYFQLAAIVSVAEAYQIPLEGESGETALLDLLGRAHGVDDLVRAGPRVLGALAKALMIKHGLGSISRLVPMISAPIAAKLNEREMEKLGALAMQRFGNVVMLG